LEGKLTEKVHFGIEIDLTDFEYVRKTALQSEELGFDSIWVYDQSTRMYDGDVSPCCFDKKNTYWFYSDV